MQRRASAMGLAFIVNNLTILSGDMGQKLCHFGYGGMGKTFLFYGRPEYPNHAWRSV